MTCGTDFSLCTGVEDVSMTPIDTINMKVLLTQTEVCATS